MDFEGKNAIVTGAGSGIGRAIAVGLSQNGASVTVADLNLEAAQKVAEEIGSHGGRALPVKVDIANAANVASLVEQSVRQLGSVDLLVNNAGVPLQASLLDTEESAWQRVIDVNLKGTFLCTKAAAKYMIEQKAGRIVNIASGQWFRPVPNNSAYAASKGGIVSFTKAIALELAPSNITVNAVVPGFTDTPMNRPFFPTEEAWRQVTTNSPLTPPLKEINQPEDIAAAVLFLLSPASRLITGQTLHVNGGSFMW